MKSKLLISAASAALIGISGIAFAQAPAPQSQGGAMQGSGSARGSEGASGSQMAPRESGTEQRAQDQSPGMKGAKDKAASDNMKGNKNAAESDLKNANPKAASEKSGMDSNKAASDTKSESKSGMTTGQAGAGGKQLTSEQRTSIHTSITKLNVRPVTNVNFSISVGTRVPRGVAFHPLPVEVVNIYPDWRGYEFILVNDQIVVVNPRTLEIVAVLEA